MTRSKRLFSISRTYRNSTTVPARYGGSINVETLTTSSQTECGSYDDLNSTGSLSIKKRLSGRLVIFPAQSKEPAVTGADWEQQRLPINAQLSCVTSEWKSRCYKLRDNWLCLRSSLAVADSTEAAEGADAKKLLVTVAKSPRPLRGVHVDITEMRVCKGNFLSSCRMNGALHLRGVMDGKFIGFLYKVTLHFRDLVYTEGPNDATRGSRRGSWIYKMELAHPGSRDLFPTQTLLQSSRDFFKDCPKRHCQIIIQLKTLCVWHFCAFLLNC